MPRLPDTSWIISLKSPYVTITFIVTPTTPGMLIYSRKDQEYRAGGIGVPGWASKPPVEPRPMVESAPPRLYPLIPPEKARKQTQDLVLKFPVLNFP